MNNFQLRNILMMAAAYYPDVLAVLVEMLRHNADALGLMAPGIPEQLAICNGVDVTANGLPLFRAVVKRRGDVFRSPMAFGRAVQEALDETTYANCLDRLRLLRVDQLPGGFVGLTMTLGSW